MVRVYGASDDLIEIEGSEVEDEIGAFDSIVSIRFDDGTTIKVSYGKEGMGIWKIEIVERGDAECSLSICEDEDDDPYSDVFEIDAEIERVEVLE